MVDGCRSALHRDPRAVARAQLVAVHADAEPGGETRPQDPLGLLRGERARLAEDIDPPGVWPDRLEHGAAHEVDVGGAVIGELVGNDVGPEEGDLVGDLPRETRQPGLTGHREVIAGLDLERGRALSVQLGDEPRQTSAQLGIRRRARRRDRATNASCGIRLTAHARLELVGAVAGEHQVRVTVDEPRDDGPPSGIHHVDIALGAVAGACVAPADPRDAAVLDEKIGVADQTGRVVGVIAQSRGVGGELADVREQHAGAHAPASIIGTVSPRSRATSRARS